MVAFNNFHTLDPNASSLVQNLLNYSDRQQSEFAAFFGFWMAFNGWLASITQAEFDADMIREVSINARLSKAFDDLVAKSPEFSSVVSDFSAMWPVWNVKDIKKRLGADAFIRLSRNDLVAQSEREGVKKQPTNWPSATVTWHQSINAIYQVRCNLFHGVKSPEISRDSELVRLSHRLLHQFVGETQCFGWVDN